jgi:hypothetical protein
MKGSVVTSAVLHGSLLAWALISISAPAHFETGDVEALPVEIVSLTQIQEGDKKAPQKEKAAPKPTTKPNKVENAEHAGDNDVDLKTPPTPEKRPQTTETAAAPPKADKPLPKTDPVPNEVKEVAKEETPPPPLPTPTPPKPEPPKEKPPEPKPPEPKPPEPQAKPAEPPPKPAETGEIPLPATVPTPVAKPKPAEPQKVAEAKPVETKPAPVAKTPDKTTGQKKQETAKSASAKESDFNADDISALLNKQQAAGGGAKRTTDVAALGGKKTTVGNTLSMSEMDGLKGQIQNNWSAPPGMSGAEGLIIRAVFKLDQSGAVIGRPEITSSGGTDMARRTFEGSVLRAIMRSSPFKNLPADKYDSWGDMDVTFDPKDML